MKVSETLRFIAETIPHTEDRLDGALTWSPEPSTPDK